MVVQLMSGSAGAYALWILGAGLAERVVEGVLKGYDDRVETTVVVGM